MLPNNDLSHYKGDLGYNQTDVIHWRYFKSYLIYYKSDLGHERSDHNHFKRCLIHYKSDLGHWRSDHNHFQSISGSI